MNSKFAFVILHYQTIDDTINCISSIVENCCKENFHIIIVDNASPNGSGSFLKEKYAKDKKITVICSEENLGFAKGNNLGIYKARNIGYDDFIIVLNNDTKIIQQNFCDKIENEYEKSDFAVLGPTIYTPKGKSSINPGNTSIICEKQLYSIIRKYKIKLFFTKMHLHKLVKLYDFFRSKLFVLKKKKCNYTQNCLLHGCCLIFSKKYLDEMHGFDPRTFLYFEENILHLQCMRKKMKMVYNPEIEIWHKEDSATDSVMKSPRKKMIFLYSNILKSIKVYKEILKENEKTE